MNLHLVEKSDVLLGKPVPWPLYDQEGRLVYSAGQIITKPLWPAGGLYRNVGDTPKPASALKPSPSLDVFPPRGVKPQIGERVQLRQTHGGASAYNANLIGYIKNKSILVTVPIQDGQRVDFLEGEALEVKMLIGKNIYHFRTEVERICVAPIHYLHLSYPKKITCHEFRQSPWVKGNFVATANGLPALISDISAFGAKIDLPGKHVDGERLKICFEAIIDEMKREITLDAVIRRHREDNAPLMECGVEFEHIEPDDLIWLKCLVYERITQGDLL